jgi:hypothetical protein
LLGALALDESVVHVPHDADRVEREARFVAQRAQGLHGFVVGVHLALFAVPLRESPLGVGEGRGRISALHERVRAEAEDQGEPEAELDRAARRGDHVAVIGRGLGDLRAGRPVVSVSRQRLSQRARQDDGARTCRVLVAQRDREDT